MDVGPLAANRVPSSYAFHGSFRLPVLSPPQKVTNFFIEEILKPSFGKKRHSECAATQKTSVNSLTTHSASPNKQRKLSSTDKSSNVTKCSQREKPAGSHRKSTSKTTDAEDRNAALWPAWVYCTRYSDRPSSG